MTFSNFTLAFVSVSTFTTPVHYHLHQQQQHLSQTSLFRRRATTTPSYRRHSVRPRWTAVAGSPPPPPPSNNNNNDENAGDKKEEPLQRESRSDDGSRDAEFNLDLTTVTTSSDENDNELFNFIKSVPPPELVKRFTQSAPPVVQKAIRETLVSILGSLPPLAFYTTVSSMTANLVQLFHSTLITGYMFRNATYRLELTRTLDWAGLNNPTVDDNNKALPSTNDKTTNTNNPEIQGGVAIFKQPDGSTVEVPVEQYIGELRQTVSNLKDELVRERKGGNELLSFISTMDKDNMEALTKNAGPEVVDAMKKVVDFVTATQGIDQTKNTVIEASAPELGQLLFYLMVSGFFLREAEVRLDLQKRIGGENALKNLLEGGSSSSPDTPNTSSDSPSPDSQQ